MTGLPTHAARVLKRIDLNDRYHSLLIGPISGLARCKPGQFVHLQLLHRDVYLRRAMSIAQVDPATKSLQIIFKKFGRGTALLSEFRTGDEIGVLGPLGTHFSRPPKSKTLIYVAGGVGLPPLLYHAETLVAGGFAAKQIHFIYGGRAADDIIQRQRLNRLKMQLHIVTEDGSFGDRGRVTDVLGQLCHDGKIRDPFLYGCGPEGMLKATNEFALSQRIPGELSLEAPMPCGVGICLGCAVQLTNGERARVCVEGPVFRIGEVRL